MLRMEQERVARKILQGRPEGRRKVRRQELTWLSKVEEDLKQVKRWRMMDRNREEWSVVVKEANVLKGP